MKGLMEPGWNSCFKCDSFFSFFFLSLNITFDDVLTFFLLKRSEYVYNQGNL